MLSSLVRKTLLRHCAGGKTHMQMSGKYLVVKLMRERLMVRLTEVTGSVWKRLQSQEFHLRVVCFLEC